MNCIRAKTGKIFFCFLISLSPSFVVYGSEINFTPLGANLPSNFTKEIVATGDYLFIATANGLVQVAAKSRKTIRTYNRASGLPDDYVTTVQVSPDEKTLWVGTPQGLAKIDINGGNSTVFNRRQKQLSDDRVSAIYAEVNQVFVGTALGVDRYDIQQNKWTAYTAIEGLAGNNIMAFAAEGDILWAAGADGISYYDRNDDFWESYGVANGLNSNLATSIVLDYDALWVGTAGGGVSRFDRNALRFEPFTSDLGLADDNVQALINDGSILWIATFDGLSMLDKASFRLTNYNARNGFKETSITSGDIIGTQIYVGTDGGAYYANKERPQVSFSFQKTAYAVKNQIDIVATIQSETGISKTDVSYKPVESIKDEWLRQGVSLTNKTGREAKVAEIDTSQMPEGRYIVRIEVKDKNEQMNRSHGIIIVDKTPPRIDLMFRAPSPNEKEIMVTGRYEEMNLATLGVDIGNKHIIPIIDRQQKRFRFPYVLGTGAKIKVSATDIAKNQTEVIKSYLVDSEPPKLTVQPIDGTKLTTNVATIKGTVQEKNIDQVIINPGQLGAVLTPIGVDLYEYQAMVPIKKEGVYTFQITAFDQAGLSATVTLPVKFYSDVTIIELEDDKIPSFTLKSEFEISGNILGPLLKEFYLEPGKINIPVKPNKSFSLRVPLKPGANSFTLVAIHENTGERIEEPINIESSRHEAGATLSTTSRSFTQKLVTLRGKFDRGITKVLINKKEAQLNSTTNEYSFEIELKEGANPVNITTVDELGRIKNQKETVYLDREPPNLYIRKLPEQTGLTKLRFRGQVKDISAYQLEVFPSGSIDFIGGDQGAFEGNLILKQGNNKITFIATDVAGNKARKDFFIQQDPSFPMREEAEGASNEEELMALRREIELLRKRTHSGPTTTLAAARLPANPGLYLVPIFGKLQNYDLAAQLYLGSEAFAPMVASFNGVPARSQALVPNPHLFRLLNQSTNRAIFDRIIKQSGQAFMKHRSSSHVQKQVLTFLSRTRQLKGVRERAGYSLFETRSGAGVIIVTQNTFSVNSLKREHLSEILVASVNKKGITFQKY